jgi:hypothetical protein
MRQKIYWEAGSREVRALSSDCRKTLIKDNLNNTVLLKNPLISDNAASMGDWIPMFL